MKYPHSFNTKITRSAEGFGNAQNSFDLNKQYKIMAYRVTGFKKRTLCECSKHLLRQFFCTQIMDLNYNT